MEVTIPAKASSNKLHFLKTLKFNKVEYEYTLSEFKSHLWYPSKELVVFKFFNLMVLFETKILIFIALEEEITNIYQLKIPHKFNELLNFREICNTKSFSFFF